MLSPRFIQRSVFYTKSEVRSQRFTLAVKIDTNDACFGRRCARPRVLLPKLGQLLGNLSNDDENAEDDAK